MGKAYTEKQNVEEYDVKTMYRQLAVLLAVTLLAVCLSACGSGTEKKWQEQYDLGIRYLSEGNYEEAIIAFTAAIEIDTKRPEAYISLAEIHMELGDYEAAAKVLEQGASNTGDERLEQMLVDIQKRLSIDLENLVTDVYSFERNSYEYRIPRVNLEGASMEQLNQEIYELLAYEDIEGDFAEYGYPFYTAVYDWAVNGDILSLVIQQRVTDWYGTDYCVYNISLSSRTVLTAEEFLRTLHISDEDYLDQVKQALCAAFLNGDTLEVWRGSSGEFSEQQFAQTISDFSAREASPFLDRSGNLCIVGKVFSIAGADSYEHEINLSVAEDYHGTLSSEYDAQGNKTRDVYRNDDGAVELYLQYQVDSARRETSVTVYGIDNIPLSQYTYDTAGNLVREDDYVSDWYFTYEYNEAGDMTKRVFYRADGSIIDEDIFDV